MRYTEAMRLARDGETLVAREHWSTPIYQEKFGPSFTVWIAGFESCLYGLPNDPSRLRTIRKDCRQIAPFYQVAFSADLKEAAVVPWLPTDDDMLAEDWRVVTVG